MSGIYIHIPFCRQACHYCDFHFSTNQSYKSKMVEEMCMEVELQKSYLKGEQIETIYFGGGTPSLLSEKEIESLLSSVYNNFSVKKDVEITLETNPDDLTAEYLKMIKSNGINRLSIGIQSFNDNFLKYLNRVHDSNAAVNCVKLAQKEGFEDITIDLIYGIPSDSNDVFLEDLKKAIELDTPHISAYCLTIEPQTVFGKKVKSGKMKAPDEELAARQFEILVNTLKKSGLEQYEISNFAKNGRYSRHNTSYWQGKNYLGIGPGAHSYNTESRQNNVSNNHKYIASLEKREVPYSIEILSDTDKVNEYLLTSIRTKWGCNLPNIEKLKPGIEMGTLFDQIKLYESRELLEIRNKTLFLTEKGKLLADEITCSLLIA